MKKIAFSIGGVALVFGGLWVYQAHEFEKIVTPYVDQYKTFNPLVSAESIKIEKYRFAVEIQKPALSSLGMPAVPQGQWQLGDTIMVHYMPLTRALKASITGPMRLKVALNNGEQIDVYNEKTDIVVQHKPSSLFGNGVFNTITAHFGPHTFLSGHNNKEFFSFKSIDLTQFFREKSGKDLNASLGIQMSFDGFKSTDYLDRIIGETSSHFDPEIRGQLSQLKKQQRQYEGNELLTLNAVLDVNKEKFDTSAPLLFSVQKETRSSIAQLAPFKLTVDSNKKDDLGYVGFTAGLDVTDKIDATFHLSSKIALDKRELYMENILKPAILNATPLIQERSKTSITAQEIEKLIQPFLDMTTLDINAHAQSDMDGKTLEIKNISFKTNNFDLAFSGTVTAEQNIKIQLTLAKAKQVAKNIGTYLNGVAFPVAGRLFGAMIPISLETLGPIVQSAAPSLIDALHNGPTLTDDGTMVTMFDYKESDKTLLINNKDARAFASSPAIMGFINGFQGAMAPNLKQ